MFFRFSRVHLTPAFPGRQSGGVCVADVQFVAVVLATHPTIRIQSAHYGSCLGPVTADDDGDLDLLSGLCGPPSSNTVHLRNCRVFCLAGGQNIAMARTLASLPTGSRVTDYISLGVVSRAIPREKIDSILASTGKASV